MRGGIVTYIITGVIIIFLQVLIFKQIQFGDSFLRHTHILFYPVILFILPLKVTRVALLFLAFGIGIVIDVFYNSMGIHAATFVFTALLRPGILKVLEPRGGFGVNISPTKFHLGLNWFLQYSALLLFLHCLTYFSIEAFTFVYWKQILLSTIFSFIISFVLIQIYIILFNPR